MKTSFGSAPTASISLATQAGSRKCWPYRFRGRGRDGPVAAFRPAARCVALLVLVQCARALAAPISLFDLLDFLFAEPEVMPDFVDQRLADDRADVVLVVAVLFDRLLKERDAIGQVVAERPAALG